ncbi:MAG: class I SAM-dependent methyltransferase [Planctomycetota bacterium]
MSSSVKDYYDGFTGHLVLDFVRSSPRLRAQYAFFEDAIPAGVERVLVVGCGTGEGAHHLATRAATSAKVLAVDISPKNVEIAQALFPHPRIEYRVVDITADDFDAEPFDAIVFPDVYEHIPVDARAGLHAAIARLLRERGRVLLTVPSPAHQAMLKAAGKGLQVVDETVELTDLTRFADDIGGHLKFFSLISVFNIGDYVHAVLGAGSTEERPIERTADAVAIERIAPPEAGLSRMIARARRYLGRSSRRRLVKSRLGPDAIDSARRMLDH